MYPARATLQHVIKAWWKINGATEGGKTLPVFVFVNEHNNLNTKTKPQAKKQRFFSLLDWLTFWSENTGIGYRFRVNYGTVHQYERIYRFNSK